MDLDLWEGTTVELRLTEAALATLSYDMFVVVVKTLDGHLFPLTVHNEDTVLAVKQQIEVVTSKREKISIDKIIAIISSLICFFPFSFFSFFFSFFPPFSGVHAGGAGSADAVCVGPRGAQRGVAA
jgi:hypothetical protein